MNKKMGEIVFVVATIIFLIGTYFEISSEKHKVNFTGIDKPYTLIVDNNTYIKKVSDPIRKGYEFIGWYNNETEFNFNEKITKDISLEAKWILK